MEKIIKTEFSENPIAVTLDGDRYAVDDDKNVHRIWVSKDLFQMGMCLGHIEFVLQGDDVIDNSLPLSSLRKFKEVSMKKLTEDSDILNKIKKQY